MTNSTSESASLNQGVQPQLPRISAVFLLLAALIGLVASLGLLKTELHYLSDPTAALSCDINVLVGCSSSILSDEAHLFFGLPNTALGIAFFSVLGFVSVGSFFKLQLPKALWNLLGLASAGSLALVAFFLYASIMKFGALCPYCLGIWSATFVSAGILLPWVASVCDRPTVKRVGTALHKNAWAVVVGFFLLTFIAVLLGLTEEIGMML